MFTFPKDEELTNEDLAEFIEQHRERIARYDKLKNMYLGDYEILHEEDKDYGKPDNRLVVNFAKYIVDTLNGYFIGHPIKTIHPDEEISERMRDIAKRNNQNDNNAELSKLCSIYGHAYEFLYQDEDANTRVTYIEPQNAFVIYDDTIAQEPLYGVYLKNDEEGILYSIDDEKDFTIEDDEVSFGDERVHYFEDVPIIEYVENNERQSVFENVETLINAYNKALSEKANDISYFSDAYLAILGIELDEETIQNIRDNRIINLKDGDVQNILVEFLEKPDADETQENMLNRLETLIFQISMVSNIDDDKFGSSSGISLRYKLQSMENLTLMKERKFNAGMVKRFKMMFAIPTNFKGDKEGYLDIDYVFTRNIPNNIEEEAKTAQALTGIASQSTILGSLSIVENVADEQALIEEEREQQAINSFEQDMNTPFEQEETVQVETDELDKLNGAQITAVLKIIEEINEGLLTVEQGRALLQDGLRIDEASARKIIK